MAIKWISSTAKGVRYREHETRKHNKRPDRYYTLQYKRNGKVYNERIGWASEGVTQVRCEADFARLRENWRTGSGGQTLKEIRVQNIEKVEVEREIIQQEKSLTMRGVFEGGYLSLQITNNKKQDSIRQEQTMLNMYVDSFFQDTPLKKIDARKMDSFKEYINKIISKRTKKPLSDATKRYIIALVSQIFNYAISRIDSTLQNPVRLISKPRSDNARERFLTVEEASKLLEGLSEKSKNTHDIALLSLFAGLRSAEILALTWGSVNFSDEKLFIKDAKNKESRHAFMTIEIKTMLQNRYSEQAHNERIFNNSEVSRTFERVVQDLGLNKGRGDRRERVVFHSLRHTFASWHAQRGTPLYTISKLLGHKSIKMTERYAHLCPTAERQATMTLQGVLEPKRANVIDFTQARGA